ncbi:hypothetical protein QNA08_12485 [Chelatococcus sp. SYSU_G07232]|uniref:Uncharacterized protein n=1 Tax=Chelatococcus albus TaxID=3047466 RepID=A0ABT7AJR2_9HYPH|nr:hypothetical protein [Chelatococcus sp. SYSU_G07232]MDJ1159054.1 hypothetical protein [Chelatococcus sp. SYSU_G07232]
MAYILRSAFFIGAIYMMSPVETVPPPATATGGLSGATAAMARPLPALGGAGVKDAMTLAGEAARVWSDLDPQTRERLLDLLAERRPAAGRATPSADTLSGRDRAVPWRGEAARGTQG